MSKKLISYKLLYWLSLIPVFGFFVSWICSWINIYRRTSDRKYVFIHYIIWMLTSLVVFIGLIAIIRALMAYASFVVYVVCALVATYVALVLMSILCIVISKIIIKKYDLKSIS